MIKEQYNKLLMNVAENYSNFEDIPRKELRKIKILWKKFNTINICGNERIDRIYLRYLQGRRSFPFAMSTIMRELEKEVSNRIKLDYGDLVSELNYQELYETR